ncbi:hypothetical protein BN136_3246 [Cronobacter universalis NCTC 9529]|nr:hypothetical protein BN136_3246 [Cronobacter universalis NCTC 9529]
MHNPGEYHFQRRCITLFYQPLSEKRRGYHVLLTSKTGRSAS